MAEITGTAEDLTPVAPTRMLEYLGIRWERRNKTGNGNKQEYRSVMRLVTRRRLENVRAFDNVENTINVFTSVNVNWNGYASSDIFPGTGFDSDMRVMSQNVKPINGSGTGITDFYTTFVTTSDWADLDWSVTPVTGLGIVVDTVPVASEHMGIDLSMETKEARGQDKKEYYRNKLKVRTENRYENISGLASDPASTLVLADSIEDVWSGIDEVTITPEGSYGKFLLSAQEFTPISTQGGHKFKETLTWEANVNDWTLITWDV